MPSERLNNLWWDTAEKRTPWPALEGPARADVVIVGAGIMGASAALDLAIAGCAVIVLEAGEVGGGASSRPGGFVVPHFSVGSPQEVCARAGAGGEALVDLVGGSAARTFARIARHGIDCEARQDGWYYPAHGRAAMDRVERTAGQWAQAGHPGQLLGVAETARRTGARGYAGSWFAPSGGTLHPLRYCRGLAEAAQGRGARVFEHSPVTAIEALAGSRYRVRTPSGTVESDRVLVCANGLAPGVAPVLSATIVPLRVFQCASDPLPASWRTHLFTGGECLSDTRRNLFTYRLDGAGRLITGALDTLGISPRRAARRMARRLARMLDLPGVPRIPHIWPGDSAISAGRMPASLSIDGGVLAASACNARGIALSSVIGEGLAAHLLGGPLPPMAVVTGADRHHAGLQARLTRLYPHFAPILDWIAARTPA